MELAADFKDLHRKPEWFYIVQPYAMLSCINTYSIPGLHVDNKPHMLKGVTNLLKQRSHLWYHRDKTNKWI